MARCINTYAKLLFWITFVGKFKENSSSTNNNLRNASKLIGD